MFIKNTAMFIKNNISLIQFDTICMLKDYNNKYIYLYYDDYKSIDNFENYKKKKVYKELTLYEPTFLVHHKYLGNFKHFTEMFYSIELFLHNKTNNKILIMTAVVYDKIKLIIEILEIHKNQILIIDINTKYYFKTLNCMIDHNNNILYSLLPQITFIETIIKNINLSTTYNFQIYNKIYLERGAKYDKRGPINEHLLHNILPDYKFITFSNETNILEQIYTIYNASVIIAPIGASVNNIIFKNNNCIFNCLIPNCKLYKYWANIYKNFNNYNIIKCGILSEDIKIIDKLNTKWIINLNFMINK